MLFSLTFFLIPSKQDSLVDNDLLRFDFYAERLLTPFELAMIEKKAQPNDLSAYEVKVEEMSLDQASKL